MNRQRARELLPIIQAFANGEDIEVRKNASWGWHTFRDPMVLETSWEYRIKPKAREFWLCAETQKT